MLYIFGQINKVAFLLCQEWRTQNLRTDAVKVPRAVGWIHCISSQLDGQVVGNLAGDCFGSGFNDRL